MKLTLKILVPLFVILFAVFAAVNMLYGEIFKSIFMESRAFSLADHAIRQRRDIFTEEDFSKKEVDVQLRQKMKQYAKELETDSIFHVKIWDKNYQVVYSDIFSDIGSKEQDVGISLKKVFEGDQPVYWQLRRGDTRHPGFVSFLQVMIPVKNYSAQTSYVYEAHIATSAILSGLDSSLNRTILLLFVAAALIFAAFYFLLQIFIIKPVGKLSREMEAVGKGMFKREVQSKSKDEIGNLYSHFNYMRLKLNEFFKQIAISQKNLEDKVAQLEKFQTMTVGRELKMIELKKELAQLKKKQEALNAKR